MAPKKKTPSNGFFFFMLELKDKQGRSFKGMAEVADAAGPIWARMSAQERKPFEDRARLGHSTKMTSSGRDLEQVERQQRLAQERQQKMIEDIDTELLTLSESNRLADNLFFVIHVNTFCYCQREDNWSSAEIAVASFSLKEGVSEENIFHAIVKPGSFPVGYASEAKLHSEKTHQLPLSAANEDNTEAVFLDLVEFLQRRNQGNIPVIYAHDDHLEMTRNVLNNWCNEYKTSFKFNIYNLQKFFTILKNTVADSRVWASDTFSYREIEKDINAYCPNISCQFHELAGNQCYCSKSIVTRYVYCICDNCCHYLGIQSIPGRHLPPDAMTVVVKKSSAAAGLGASSVKTTSASKQSTVKDDDLSTVKSFSKTEYSSESMSMSNISFNDFPALGESVVPRGSWQLYNPVEAASRSLGLSPRGPELGLDSETSSQDFPELGRGRGKGAMRGKNPNANSLLGRGRGSVYDRKN